MARLARMLTTISLYLGLATLVRFPTTWAGWLQSLPRKQTALWLAGQIARFVLVVVLEVPKLIAGFAAPFAALAGGVGAMVAGARGDRRAAVAGSIGALVLARQVRRVTATHDGLEQAFGAGWPTRIPESLKPRLARQRWQFPARRGTRSGARRTRDVVCGTRAGGGGPLLCDVWQPPPDVPPSGLAVLYLHGTAWQAMDKGMTMGPLFETLTGQGHVVVDLGYTLTPQANLWEILGEVKQAVAWIKARAGDYGVNQERVVAMGSSGGGHLALLAAYTANDPGFQRAGLPGDTSVRAVVSLYGPTDLVAHWHEYGRMQTSQPATSVAITDDMRPSIHDHSFLDRLLTRWRIWPAYRYQNMPGGSLLLVGLLGGTLAAVPDAYRRASPVYHVSAACPPTLQIFGAHDFYFSPNHGRRLHRALRACGATSVYVELPDTEHAFDAFLWHVSPAAQAAAYDMERFLALMV